MVPVKDSAIFHEQECTVPKQLWKNFTSGNALYPLRFLKDFMSGTAQYPNISPALNLFELD